MNIRFTIEEENIIAIYAEDSGKQRLKISLPPCPIWTRICASLPPQR